MKNMEKTDKIKKDVIRRLKIVEGHLKRVIEMVEEDKYCIDVLQQTVAVKSAIKKAEELLLNNHLNSCLVQAIKNDKDKRAINEVMEVFKKAGI